jgi:ABC-type uncharacterized transport system ATPase component
MQQTLVEERRWIAREEYVEGLALAPLVPGPLAAQLAMYLGYVRGGILGASRLPARWLVTLACCSLTSRSLALDPELRATLRGELRRLQRALGLTTIYVTHDREDAVALAACTMEMRAGRIISSDANRAKERVKADQ